MQITGTIFQFETIMDRYEYDKNVIFNTFLKDMKKIAARIILFDILPYL